MGPGMPPVAIDIDAPDAVERVAAELRRVMPTDRANEAAEAIVAREREAMRAGVPAEGELCLR